MSDAAMVHDVDSSTQPTDGPAGPTAGALLTQLREAAGMHREALAAMLKVPEAKLAALESDHYERFAEPVFMRALASSVCRVLQADSAPVLALLPSSKPAPLRVDHGLNAAFKEPGRKAGAGASLDRPKPRLLGFVVAALLVGALAIAFYPAGRNMGQAHPDEAAQADDAAPAAAPMALAQFGAPAGDAADAVAGSAAAPAAAPAAESGAPVPAAVAAAASATAPEAAAPAAAAPVAAAQADGAAAAAAAPAPAAGGDAVLLIRATTGQSWVQVRGSDGKVVLERLLSPGQSAAVPGTPPWSVVVGKADVTEVLVRGKAMDLAAVARENVARFEVK
jgi:cytoskeleton protein RodZ